MIKLLVKFLTDLIKDENKTLWKVHSDSQKNEETSFYRKHTNVDAQLNGMAQDILHQVRQLFYAIFYKPVYNGVE